MREKGDTDNMGGKGRGYKRNETEMAGNGMEVS